MRLGIVQSNYIPWRGYFDFINSVDTFVLLDTVQYTKRDWRSRNQIKTSEGLHWLSIPVDTKGKFNQKICEVRVSDETWSRKHWKTISQSYKKANCFSEVSGLFATIYEEISTYKFLTEINFHFISSICKFLGIDTKILFAIDVAYANDFEDKSQRLLEICRALKATTYLSGSAAKDYLDEKLFNQSGISVEWLKYPEYPVYDQPHGEFAHNLSILDTLFCVGKDARQFCLKM
jgi:hypothetical protein